LSAELRYRAAQFQVLRYGSPEGNSMLVNCFCYIQSRMIESNLVQHSSVSGDRLATIVLSPEFDKKFFTECPYRWLPWITSYHIFKSWYKCNLLNILVCQDKFISMGEYHKIDE